MLRSIDLASGSITASLTPGVKIFPRNGRGLGHVIIFGVKPRSLNFTDASTTPHQGLNGYNVGHVIAV